MANSEDTEITLGTGKMLAIFFGLVALCAVFFGMGFSLGKTSAAPSGVGVTSVNSSASSTRPAAMKPSGSAASPDLSFYKTVGQKEPDTQLSAADTGAAQASPPSAPDPAAAPPLNGYYVQVAAVSKEEDARPLRRHQRRGRHAGQAGGGWIQSDFEEVTCIVGAETSEFKTKADLRSSSSATPAWS